MIKGKPIKWEDTEIGQSLWRKGDGGYLIKVTDGRYFDSVANEIVRAHRGKTYFLWELF